MAGPTIVALQVSPGQGANSGLNATVTLQFSIAGGVGPYTVQINWGDGNNSSIQVPGGPITSGPLYRFLHTYASFPVPNPFTIQITGLSSISEPFNASIIGPNIVSGGGGGGSTPSFPSIGGSQTVTQPVIGVGSNKQCNNRLIKNAKFIQSKAALLNAAVASQPGNPFLGLSAAGMPSFNPAFIIPQIEPKAGYSSIIPQNVLNQIEPVNGIGAGFFHSDANGNLVPDVTDGQQFGPVFNGVVYFVNVTYQAGSQNITVPAADIQTALSVLTSLQSIIAQYCQQYGTAGMSVQAKILNFTAVVNADGTFNDQSIGGVPSGAQGWADQIASTFGLAPNGTNVCLIFLAPASVKNTDADPSIGILGYHNISQGNMPYIFVNLGGTPLISTDTQDWYELALTHEAAEMIVDPFANLSNPEVCDPCGPNCQTVFRDYFDASGNYLASLPIFPPPGVAYATFINAIVQPVSANQCPAPATACAYGPTSNNPFPVGSPGTNTSGTSPVGGISQSVLNPTGQAGITAAQAVVKPQAMKTQVLPLSPAGGPAVIKLPLGS